MSNNYIINSDGKVFDGAKEETKISGTPVVLDSRTAIAVSDAETLDRYDDFSDLRINTSLYAASGSSQYGIPHIREIHGNGGVILDHQKTAAHDFLRELRGFGLLADVVGSGKTYEAGIVLSELAARGRLKSLLVVVPEQVYSNWVRVLEMSFGMGKGSLEEKTADDRYFDKYEEIKHGRVELRRPTRPVIVKTEDFVQWTEKDIRNLLFDVIVIDEAHHLCLEEGENARALKFLSILMQNKKLANSTYCLLLSATPHSGNLEKMFRLWYFIRCKGGYPDDFDEKEDADRTEDYRTEKQYYLDVVCRGAHTVSEYINVSKRISIDQRFSKEFSAYLSECGKAGEFDSLTDWEKQKVREEFLHALGNEKICQTVLEDAARGYHNGVMRSIMIRQPNSLPKKRWVNNIFICPVAKKLSRARTIEDGVTLDPYDPEADGAVKTKGGSYSLSEYLLNKNQDNSKRRAEIWISRVLGSEVFEDKSIFEKDQSLKFYWEQLQDDPYEGYTNNEFRILDGYDKQKAESLVFDMKMRELEKILSLYNDERVLIFFDYEKHYGKAEGAEWERVYAALGKGAHKDRLCLALGNNISDSEKFFKANPKTVFIVGDPAYTEGSNYQESHVVINFSVTPDPLAMDQRIGRIFRLGQKHDVQIFSFAAMNALEGYALAYFSRIGLLSSNSGDATIIAGSNNERMVAVQCPACGKMLLYPSDEFATRKLNDNLYCNNSPKCCAANPKGTVMREINIYEFKCDKCGETLSRTGDKGYRCFATSDGQRGKLMNIAGEGNRTYACSKLCAIRHCSRIKGFAHRCPLLDANASVGIAEMKRICYTCKNFKERLCRPECTMLFDNSLEAIEPCRECDNSSCTPKPHSFDFDDKWTAPCPKCNGRLRPILAHTFATYIRASYEFNDGGLSFCRNLMQEADHVADIRNVLKKDDKEKAVRN